MNFQNLSDVPRGHRTRTALAHGLSVLCPKLFLIPAQHKLPDLAKPANGWSRRGSFLASTCPAYSWISSSRLSDEILPMLQGFCAVPFGKPALISPVFQTSPASQHAVHSYWTPGIHSILPFPSTLNNLNTRTVFEWLTISIAFWLIQSVLNISFRILWMLSNDSLRLYHSPDQCSLGTSHYWTECSHASSIL